MQHDSAPTPNREYVDDRDLSRLTPISRSQWQLYRQHGEGPPFRRIGRRCVYRWADVVAWLDARPAGRVG